MKPNKLAFGDVLPQEGMRQNTEAALLQLRCLSFKQGVNVAIAFPSLCGYAVMWLQSVFVSAP